MSYHFSCATNKLLANARNTNSAGREKHNFRGKGKGKRCKDSDGDVCQVIVAEFATSSRKIDNNSYSRGISLLKSSYAYDKNPVVLKKDP